MRRRRTVEQWRQCVFGAAVPDSVKVYLLKLADHMDARRYVSVPRKVIAAELGKHEQRIAERTKAAIEAGLLDTVSPGRKGRTAVYQGLFPDQPDAVQRTDSQYPDEAPKGTSARYAKKPHSVPDGEYTSSKRKAPRTPPGHHANDDALKEDGQSIITSRREAPATDVLVESIDLSSSFARRHLRAVGE